MVSRVSNVPVEVLFSRKSILDISNLALELIIKTITPREYVSNLVLELIVNVPPPPPTVSVSHDVVELLLYSTSAKELISNLTLELIVNIPEEVPPTPQLARGRLGPRIQSM